MIDRLTQNFIDELPVRLSELQAAWKTAGANTPAAWQEIRRISHSLAGAASSFGYVDIGEAARKVDSIVRQLPGAQGDKVAILTRKLTQALNTLGASLDKPVRNRIPPTLAPVFVAEKSLEPNKLIYLVDDSLSFCQLMAAEIAHFGFEVQGVVHLDRLPALLDHAMPDAIIMDVLFPEGALAGPETIQRLRAKLPQRVPVIFMSADNSLATRLAAVRAGGQAFFAKPFDVTELIDTLDQFLLTEPPEPYRILIVEDSPALAQLYAETLKMVGMATCTLTTPLKLLETMHDFRPDLLLMDIYMPEANGVELARVVRQHHAYFGLPIVYLSAEQAAEKQFAALGEGADDFLVKPVDPERLVHAIRARASRYQALRAQMVKDSMTGLLNHSHVLERLDHELHRARRIAKPLSVAMIDIDHFKQVNDTYGHAVGDHVILTLSRLLKERLRNSDAVGRYGGEEFLVIMPDTGPDQAFQVIDSLRDSFSTLTQHAGLKTFRCSFSAGISGANIQGIDHAVVMRADRALYAAKSAGRNRVCQGEC